MTERSSAVTAWPPIKKAIWDVLMAEHLNDGHYIKAFDLAEKLSAAVEPLALAQQTTVPATCDDLGGMLHDYDYGATKKMTLCERLSVPPKIRHDLTRCPFCGASPQVEFWHGGGPQKRLISCSGDDCEISPSVTGETLRSAIAKWERRAP